MLQSSSKATVSRLFSAAIRRWKAPLYDMMIILFFIAKSSSVRAVFQSRAALFPALPGPSGRQHSLVDLRRHAQRCARFGAQDRQVPRQAADRRPGAPHRRTHQFRPDGQKSISQLLPLG